MKSRSRNKKAIVVIISLLAITIAFIFALYQALMYQKPSGWQTYGSSSIPFEFDHPPTISFSSLDSSQNATTLKGLDGDKEVISIAFEDVKKLPITEAGQCFEYDHSTVGVSNKISSETPIQVCGERKLWQYSYDTGHKRITLVSQSNMSIETFKRVVSSLRMK